jgi:hypothetical protein
MYIFYCLSWLLFAFFTFLMLRKVTPPNDIRTVNAQATAGILQKREYLHVRALVTSSTGAGCSRIVIGLGLGAIFSHHLRHVLADHSGQEAAFLAEMKSRTTTVRATSLTTGKPTGKLVTFADTIKSPSIKTDRADLAAWVVIEICGAATLPKGGVVNVTGVKK